MFIYFKAFIKMTMFPMVIFVLAITAFKFGPVSHTLMENSAEASMKAPDQPSDISKGIFAGMSEWRQAKIVRTSLNYDPSLFYKLTDADIRHVFGTPSLTRREGNARMIQYTYNDCVADFYYTVGSDAKISHYEIRQLKGNQAPDCLTEIVNNL